MNAITSAWHLCLVKSGRLTFICTLVMLAFLPLPGVTATVTGHVVGVDNYVPMSLLDINTSRHEIRLRAIEAPRFSHAFVVRLLQTPGAWKFRVDTRPAVPWNGAYPPTSPFRQARAGQHESFPYAEAVTMEHFFNSLKRPTAPNTWLVAPADFVIRPDAVAPLFETSASVLHETFKSVMLGSPELELAEESANGMHVIATTSIMKFRDDIRVMFIPIAPGKSTIAIYSASRIGYWDLGVNRRRLTAWIAQVQHALAQGRK